MRSYIVAVAGLLVLAAGTSLHAVETTSSSVDELRSAKERAELQASQTKGAPQHLLLMKSQRISGLIDRLERGGAVDPREIDRLLDETSR